MRSLESLYSSLRLDRRIRLVRGATLDVTLWARRIEAETIRTLELTQPIPDNEVKYVYLIRWRSDVANVPVDATFRITELPASDGDNGYRVRTVTEVGRRKYLKLETGIL